ncbi:hypothetical protein [Lacrimispora sp.]|uniref:hypothetical protein n=1 Tax=Lacrimispora sp. TaxID=2719234 RepID=UPI0028650E36|nr:hypothetical protein [Lacrimispora sp.]MDR7813889.1 hypothetical protein [Lacrimispora sp.]
MKKSILFVATAATVTLLTACLSGVTSGVTQEQPLEASINESESKVNETEVTTTVDIINTLPKKELLDQALSEALTEIGVTQQTITNYENYSEQPDSDYIFVDAIIETDLRVLRCVCSFSKANEYVNYDSWSVFSIENDENKHCYYGGGYEGTIDLYNYQTDILTSKKWREAKDVNIAEEFDKEVSRLKDKAKDKAKADYETGITFEQLSNSPDRYKDQKVKFSGKVLQVIEGNYGEIYILLVIDIDRSSIISGTYLGYIFNPDEPKILENSTITIYGTFEGLKSYQNSKGDTLTVSSVMIDQLNQ